MSRVTNQSTELAVDGRIFYSAGLRDRGGVVGDEAGGAGGCSS